MINLMVLLFLNK